MDIIDYLSLEPSKADFLAVLTMIFPQEDVFFLINMNILSFDGIAVKINMQ